MKKHTLWMAPVAGAMAMAAPAMGEDAPPAEPTAGQIKLAKMLEGRVAGEGENCIRLFPTANLTVIDRTALVYKQGRTLYVNVPRNAEMLDDNDALVTRPQGNNLCRTDIVTTVDRFGGHYTGNIMLGDFVPYRMAEKDG